MFVGLCVSTCRSRPRAPGASGTMFFATGSLASVFPANCQLPRNVPRCVRITAPSAKPEVLTRSPCLGFRQTRARHSRSRSRLAMLYRLCLHSLLLSATVSSSRSSSFTHRFPDDHLASHGTPDSVHSILMLILGSLHTGNCRSSSANCAPTLNDTNPPSRSRG